MKLSLRIDIPKDVTMSDLKYILNDTVENLPDRMAPLIRKITDCDNDDLYIGTLEITK